MKHHLRLVQKILSHAWAWPKAEHVQSYTLGVDHCWSQIRVHVSALTVKFEKQQSFRRVVPSLNAGLVWSTEIQELRKAQKKIEHWKRKAEDRERCPSSLRLAPF